MEDSIKCRPLELKQRLVETKVMLSQGGRCWFTVKTKSFELTVEKVGGKIRGVIVERSRGFSSRVWFGGPSLRCLLEEGGSLL